MRDEFIRALRGLKDNIGEDGIEKLADVLAEKGDESNKRWQTALLSGLSDAVRKKGPDGLDFAVEQIEKALAGDHPDFEFASLRTRSDLLAELQNAEANKRKRIEGFLQAAVEIIKKVVLAAI